MNRPSESTPVALSVVKDKLGEPIRLTLVDHNGVAAVVALDSVRAVRLAAWLIEASLPRLSG
jgi:hypothetical protein